jgi:hypothetical protein
MAFSEMTTHKQIDCRSETGITIGLTDAILTITHLLIDRDLEDVDVKEALKDLKADPDFNDLLLVMKNIS